MDTRTIHKCVYRYSTQQNYRQMHVYRLTISLQVITGGYATTVDVRNMSIKRLNDNKPILSLAPLGPTKYHIDHIDHIGHIATSAEKMSPK